jgi:hypothetical protein
MQTDVSSPPEYASTALSFDICHALRLPLLHLCFLIDHNKSDLLNFK